MPVLPLRRDQVFWGGFGIVLALLTMARPWWFWENPKARWLRRLIGDEATALVYFTVALGCLYAAMAGWRFGR